jgi:LacI family transcriptional regulator, repressor for deo operon, udp, cdd, tsx, nupC, and nupG
VARECGVTASTVSRAFCPAKAGERDGGPDPAAGTRLGYRANPHARALPTGKTSIIALLVGDITSPVNFEIILGGEAAAGDGGYTMVLADAQESPRTERDAIQPVVPTVEGLVSRCASRCQRGRNSQHLRRRLW